MQKLLTYKNGLRVVVDTMPGVKTVSSGIWVGVGSGKETPDINGLSHFTEHMIFKGTDKLSAYDIANKFESMGAHVNAFTSKAATCYYVKSIDEYFGKCFDTLAHIFFDSKFDDKELNKERKVILEEINMVEDSPEDICYDLLAKCLYGDTAIGQTILGSIDNVKRFKSTDVKNFINRFYCANQMVISFAGNINEDQVDALVKKHVLPKLNTNIDDSKETKKITVKRNHVERIKDFEQSNIVLSFPSIEFDNELSSTQNVLNAIMGGGMSSRLFQTIREKMGLAYSVYTSPSAHLYNGSFNVVLNISPENTDKALQAVMSEIKKVVTGDIKKAEVDRAKVQLKSSLIYSRENVQSVMIAGGRMMLGANKQYDINDRIKMIDSVTLTGVNKFAKDIFTDSAMCSSYVGKAYKADFSKLLLCR